MREYNITIRVECPKQPSIAELVTGGRTPCQEVHTDVRYTTVEAYSAHKSYLGALWAGHYSYLYLMGQIDAQGRTRTGAYLPTLIGS